MTTEIFKNIFRFILLVFLQVLIIQNINLSSYIILLPYVLVILMLPFETPRLFVLFISFLLGVCIDYFYDSSGIHSAACTFIGFFRHYVLKYFSPRDGYEVGLKPTIRDMGINWFLNYIAILIFSHHFLLFYLEVFRFSEFFSTLLRIILSSMGTFGLVYIIHLLIYNNQKKA